MKTHEIHYTLTLDYCDGIQLFAAEDGAGGSYIAALVEIGKKADQYLVVECESENLLMFRSGAIDLRSMMQQSAKHGWYLADVASFTEPFRVIPQKGTDIPDELLPGDGLYLDEIRDDSEKSATTYT